jgi:hypothetical protein
MQAAGAHDRHVSEKENGQAWRGTCLDVSGPNSPTPPFFLKQTLHMKYVCRIPVGY